MNKIYGILSAIIIILVLNTAAYSEEDSLKGIAGFDPVNPQYQIDPNQTVNKSESDSISYDHGPLPSSTDKESLLKAGYGLVNPPSLNDNEIQMLNKAGFVSTQTDQILGNVDKESLIRAGFGTVNPQTVEIDPNQVKTDITSSVSDQGILETDIIVSLQEALDNFALSFSSGGQAYWYGDTDIYSFNGDAARSGVITHNQESWMQTTVTGPGTVRFLWSVSSEDCCDFLEFYIDGALQNRISGYVPWQQQNYHISTPGTHTLKWRYMKDGSVNLGNDAGYVDKLEYFSPDISLEQALDNYGLIFTTGGAYTNWIGQNSVYAKDGNAAKSGTILDGGSTWMQTTVTGPGTVRFIWSVSSESCCDFLEFYIDGVLQNRISGTVPWQQQNYYIGGSGTHTLKWQYMKDGSVSTGSDAGYVDHVEYYTPQISLEEAVDNYAYAFTTGGAYTNWIGQNMVSMNGDSARSGTLMDSASTWMQTTVYSAGALRFRWKVSSEANFDFLQFYIDGVLQESISGEIGWQAKNYYIGPGTHTIKWQYTKDGSVSLGSDAGWVDMVEFYSPISTLPLAVDNNALSFTTSSANWIGQNSVYFFAANAAMSGAIADNGDSWIQTTVNGPGTVRFFWSVSSEVNFDYLEFFIDGVLQNSISGAVNWEKRSYTITTGGVHTLKWQYRKDGSVSMGGDAGWVDKIEYYSPIISLAEAVDNYALTFTTNGENTWLGQNHDSFYGGDSARSGTLDYNSRSWLNTTVTGPGVLYFWWAVSSEPNFDFLVFNIDGGAWEDRISGNPGWSQRSFNIPSGTHTLSWMYGKDLLISTGSDAGWVDKVEFFPTQTPDFSLSATPAYQSVTAGSPAIYTVTVTPLNGFISPVSLSTSGLPGGATASFIPNPVTPGATSTMTITTSGTTPIGSYPINITGTGGGQSHSFIVTLDVQRRIENVYATILPSTRTVSVGQTFTVNVSIDPRSQPTSGVQFTLSYDMTLVRVNSVTERNFLSQGGWSTYFNPGTIDNNAGRLRDVYGVITTPGGYVTNPGTFAEISLTALATGTSHLNLENVIVSRQDGTGYSVIRSNGSVTISTLCAPWDVNCDCTVDVRDLVLIGQHFGEITIPPYPAWDVNRDGATDVRDLVLVGQHFGETTC